SPSSSGVTSSGVAAIPAIVPSPSLASAMIVPRVAAALSSVSSSIAPAQGRQDPQPGDRSGPDARLRDRGGDLVAVGGQVLSLVQLVDCLESPPQRAAVAASSRALAGEQEPDPRRHPGVADVHAVR